MLAAVHVAREEQHAAGRGKNEHDADHCLLHLRPYALGPGEEQCTAERGDQRGDLNGDAVGLEAELIGK